jgi:hypothetical protein
VVEKIQRLLNPILSRFCEIYIPENCFIIEKTGKSIVSDYSIASLHQSHIEQLYQTESTTKEKHDCILKVFEHIKGKGEVISILVQQSVALYENGISALDIIYTINKTIGKDQERNTLITMCFYKIKYDLRCEKMMIFYILYFFFISSDEDIKYILLV